MSVDIFLAHAGEGHLFSFDVPPLHPILVNFTAALIPSSFVADLLGRLTGRRSLCDAGWWMLLFGAAVTPFTAWAGWYWLGRMGDMHHEAMGVHKWLGTALGGPLFGLTWWRWRSHRDDRAPGVAYLAVAAVVTLAVAVQGHLGGGMSFGTGDAGHDHGRSPAPATAPSEPEPHDHGAHGSADGRAWRDYIEVGGGRK